jgi:hypothetical protein
MKFTPLLIALTVPVLTACGGARAPSVPAQPDKIAGPNVKTLSHEDLMAVLHECHQYGSSDDPKVKYTIEYCSEAQSAHSMEGYAAPSRARVDPTLNPLH